MRRPPFIHALCITDDGLEGAVMAEPLKKMNDLP